MVRVPSSVRTEVAAALGASSDSLEFINPVSGGCISLGVGLVTGSDRFFLKWRDHSPPSFFSQEAQGLQALARGPLLVPNVEAQGTGWLLLQWVESAPPDTHAWEHLGHGLAELHRGQVAQRFGWESANFIGSLPQPNHPTDSWGEFWCDVRLRPCMEEAGARRLLTENEVSKLDQTLEVIFGLIDHIGTTDGPSLLHGDLWSGNVMFARPGDGNTQTEPVIFDPAVYFGHREVDLAMTRLFGGFPASFYDAYQEAWPLVEGREARMAAYQLYPLLVHLLLFGRSYAGQLMSTARRLSGT